MFWISGRALARWPRGRDHTCPSYMSTIEHHWYGGQEFKYPFIHELNRWLSGIVLVLHDQVSSHHECLTSLILSDGQVINLHSPLSIFLSIWVHKRRQRGMWKHPENKTKSTKVVSNSSQQFILILGGNTHFRQALQSCAKPNRELSTWTVRSHSKD